MRSLHHSAARFKFSRVQKRCRSSEKLRQLVLVITQSWIYACSKANELQKGTAAKRDSLTQQHHVLHAVPTIACRCAFTEVCGKSWSLSASGSDAAWIMQCATQKLPTFSGRGVAPLINLQRSHRAPCARHDQVLQEWVPPSNAPHAIHIYPSLDCCRRALSSRCKTQNQCRTRSPSPNPVTN